MNNLNDFITELRTLVERAKESPAYDPTQANAFTQAIASAEAIVISGNDEKLMALFFSNTYRFMQSTAFALLLVSNE